MHLLIVSSEFPPGPGGIGTHAYELAKHFQRFGWEVTVCTPQDYASEQEVATFNAAQPFAVRPFQAMPGLPAKALYRIGRVAGQVRSKRPDVVLATGKRAVWITAVVAGWYGIPWVAVGHGTEFGSTIQWDRAISRWAYQHATAVVCVSDYTRSQMKAMGIQPMLSQVIPNGADPERFWLMTPEERARFRQHNSLDEAAVLLTVGRVSERKGQDVVIRALPYILQHVPNAHYLIAGLPEQEDAFAALARQSGVRDHVHFLGRVEADEVVQLYNGCDVFVMVSKRTRDGDVEGYGIAVIEAALCGKPAVVSSDSGLIEAIEQGVTGFAVPPDDEQATAQAILRLLLDDQKRRRMGEAAKTRAIQKQTWGHRARAYEAFLHALLKEPTHVAPSTMA